MTIDLVVPQPDGSVVQERPTFSTIDAAVAYLLKRQASVKKTLAAHKPPKGAQFA